MRDETGKVPTGSMGWLAVMLLAGLAGTLVHVFGGPLWLALLAAPVVLVVGWLLLRQS